MSIKLHGYEFEGPYKSKSGLKNQSGVYIIYCPTSEGKYKRLDAGESEDLRQRVESHDREECWERNCDSVMYAAHYVSGAKKRREIEAKIRKDYKLPCGEE